MEQIVKTFCVWSDLLGFSAPFAEGNWSFDNDQSRRNIARLSNVWQVAHSASSPLDEVALFLNDGIARVHDYEPELETPGDNVMTEFLHNRCFHEWVGKNVSADGVPSQIVPVQSQYAVTTIDSGEELEVRVMRDTGQGSQLYYAFRYTKSPIQVDNNGLKIRVHKIVGGEIPAEFANPWANVKLDKGARADLIKSL